MKTTLEQNGTTIDFQSVEDIPKIQNILANLYQPNTGIYIFDNAERLETGDKFGIDKFLCKKFIENKPIFIATSRNGSEYWRSENSNIIFIRIEPLKGDEATPVLKNYLRIQPKNIPGRENDVSLLVKTLGGFPLALRLVGSAIYQKAREDALDEIDFDSKIGSRINKYAEILKDVSLEGICEMSKYEAALDVIYKNTLTELETRDKGSIAVELFNIMACLHPDGLYLGLIDAIYSGTTCNSPDDDKVKNSEVKAGIKLLIDFSIISYESKFKAHRLIQQCALKAMKIREPVKKIEEFFERNNDNDSWEDHLHTLRALCP